MPRFGPVSRCDLVSYLRRLGFEGPFTGGRHQYMLRGTIRLWVPNPHRGDISRALMERLLRQAEISRDEWETL